MDNLGDWLYIILLVIAGISGLLSSARKKKQPAEVLEQPDIYGDETPDDSFPHPDGRTLFPPYHDIPAPAPAAIEKKKETLTDYFSKPSQEGQRVIQTSFADLSEAGDSSWETGFHISGESFQDTDEAKKAIIYSEILNRKY
jgi:hypothetical protein